MSDETKYYGARVTRDRGRLASVQEKAPSAVDKFPTKKSKVRDAASLLKALGTDWRVLRANKVHDHRMTVTIDGMKYTLYMRKG